MPERPARAMAYGAWLLVLSALVGLIVAAVNAFNPGNGIAFSFGAYLVLASTTLLLVAALIVAFVRSRPRWLGGLLSFLALLDLIGTGLAAYFLEANILLGAMVVGLIGWLVHLFVDPSPRPDPTDTMKARAA
ncbi:hypothetical protein [Aurantimonas sp. VKM B-3413]|uniref:hypothetical protein n=1 Tax=Aurantimonas sp. VKM B-3413 TaxID=2779401 RepID=UPI001E48A8B3|nr:hypothetical protein [Aurantimonas sp. VKM B-3413]MCB8837588.1 hypothetical protein [Aurantimonas sp. VKM B-3413]